MSTTKPAKREHRKPTPMKKCSICHALKATGVDGKKGKFYVNNANPDGLSYNCKECVKRLAQARHEKAKATKIPSEKAVKRMIDREKAAKKSKDSAAATVTAATNL